MKTLFLCKLTDYFVATRTFLMLCEAWTEKLKFYISCRDWGLTSSAFSGGGVGGYDGG